MFDATRPGRPRQRAERKVQTTITIDPRYMQLLIDEYGGLSRGVDALCMTRYGEMKLPSFSDSHEAE